MLMGGNPGSIRAAIRLAMCSTLFHSGILFGWDIDMHSHVGSSSYIKFISVYYSIIMF